MSSGKILYIEDNEQNFYLVKVLLSTRDYEVIWARDGQEGIDKAEQSGPDLILLDIQLPVMDGYEVASRLRSKPELTGIPIVAVTSYAMAGDREKALSAGCNGYIEKPIDPDTFLAQIDKYFPGTDSARNIK
ncbi:MAG: response regulator [Dehalococcoidia bacterium]|jgi:CheY-like chemotaxis protein